MHVVCGVFGLKLKLKSLARCVSVIVLVLFVAMTMDANLTAS
jgi:hypothetical protein